MLLGLSMCVSGVAVAMKSELMVCRCCRMLIQVSSDVGVAFHWEGDYFFIDVVLLFSDTPTWHILYRQVYGERR